MNPLVRFFSWVMASLAMPIQMSAIVPLTHAHKSLETIFQEGRLLFKGKEYAAAKQCFEDYLNGHGKKYQKEKVLYYMVLAAAHNNEPHVERHFQYFIDHYPNSRKCDKLRYSLAKYFFTKGSFSKSLTYYQHIHFQQLSSKKKNDFHYDLSYTYLKLKQWNKAKKLLRQIKRSHPCYYQTQLHLAHIALEQEDYNKAFTYLETASKDRNCLAASRTLTLKLYHRTKHFESLLAYATEAPLDIFSCQDHLFIADAYLFTQQYDAAVIHYQACLADKAMPERDILLKLGYAHYKRAKYALAMTYFARLSDQKDKIGHVAAYYSGRIYEKEGNIAEAIGAFSAAARQDIDPSMRDIALLKAAGLCYQQGNLSKVVHQMTHFIQSYPQSKQLLTAHALLVECYYKSGEYKKTIDYIEALSYKNETLLRLYQKALLYQGIETYNAEMFDVAVTHFNKALLIPCTASITLQAQFWLAEACSALAIPKEALKHYKALMQQGSLNPLYHERVLYGLGYAYFNMQDYTSAIQALKEYVALTQKQPTAMYYDALLRLGDCYYVKKNYTDALALYGRADAYDPAHARYQSALIHHALGNGTLAIQYLQQIMASHMHTKYYIKACYQEATIHFKSGHYKAAVEKFNALIAQEAAKDLQPDLLMKRALAYENLQNLNAASLDYTAILEQYPTHLHAANALMALTNLFAAQGTPEKIAPYMSKHRALVEPMTHSEDNVINIARKLFDSQEYEKALIKLNDFEQKNRKSDLLGEAYYLMAESCYRLQKQVQAINYYKKVLANNSQRKFHIKAHLRMIDLAYSRKCFEEALTHCQALKEQPLTPKQYDQMLMGLIKASFILKKHQLTIPACLRRLNNPKNAPMESMQTARLYLGKIAIQRSEFKNAKSHFSKAREPLYTASAAEAQYLLACVAFKQKAYNTSLEALFELLEKFTHNQKYLDDAFLLMADNYIMLENHTQAEATLRSLIRQSKHPRKVHLAKQKIKSVLPKLKK